ncbi:hypothetical protein BD626DRAFT_483216 [Schizophyllum amplum]|uniref:Uncharacterized protein n=1 Tax=Schizophyllum amplum TaxID=97359 RepID=A0A550CP72_9AGAR|nr:hypothetical protein BD626DRAFT_483216 [Auriculariopsis ampla]
MSSPKSKKNLPPPRKGPVTRPVDAPLSKTNFSTFIYALFAILMLITAYYSYRTVQIKTEVGGWWNLAMGKRPNYMQTPEGRDPDKIGHHAGDETVESRINALADALGLQSKDLASAIAVAVKEHVPPASLSSVAASQTGDAVEAMITETPVSTAAAGQATAKKGEAGWMEGVAGMADTFVGMDEP